MIQMKSNIMLRKTPGKEPPPVPTERAGIFKVGVGTLINKDMTSLDAYKKRKKKMQDIDNLKVQVEDIQNDLQIIKNLLLEKLK
jgi:hypothetical protein